jgi:hypothetical protein
MRISQKEDIQIANKHKERVSINRSGLLGKGMRIREMGRCI